MKITKGLTFPLAILAFLSLIVYLAGLAAMQRECYATGFPLIQNNPGLSTPRAQSTNDNSAVGVAGAPAGVNLLGNSSPTGVFGMSNGSGNCTTVFRWYWFTFAFVLVTLLGLLVTAGTGLGLHFSRPFWIGMVTISTLLMMIASEAFLAFTNGAESLGLFGYWVNSLRCTAAGAIISVAFLVLLLMAIGTDWEHRRGAGRGVDKPTTAIAVPAGTVNTV
eukprot:GHRR01000037.1.p1 GENE.GHRR01000037.1~~GHRR01000037.1.p1  ORF type:complete len:220 (+),score=52.13 GHRR01000037.1:233-892(+)